MNQSRTVAAIAVVIIAVFVVLILSGKLSFKDDRTTTDRIGDAVHALPNGPDKAVDQLGDRSTGQRVGDQIKQIGK